MATVNLYDVLDLQPDCDKQHIKDAYKRLALIYHPDKPTGDAEMFELITHAFNVLNNPQTRTDYNHIYTLSKKVANDHSMRRKQYDEYSESLKTEAKKKSKEDAEKEYAKAAEDMNRRRSYNPDVNSKELTAKETDKMLRDMALAREQEDIENIHDKLFDGGRFDPEKFNAAFDMLHNGLLHSTDIVHAGQPDAYNSIDGFGSSFTPLDKYEDIFDDEDNVNVGGATFSPIKSQPSKPTKKISSADVEKLKGAQYTKNHNVKEKDYDKLLESRMREREVDTLKYKDRTMKDFDTDVSCGGYGIFEKVGIKNTSLLTLENDDNIESAYKKLLESRNKQ